MIKSLVFLSSFRTVFSCARMLSCITSLLILRYPRIKYWISFVLDILRTESLATKYLHNSTRTRILLSSCFGMDDKKILFIPNIIFFYSFKRRYWAFFYLWRYWHFRIPFKTICSLSRIQVRPPSYLTNCNCIWNVTNYEVSRKLWRHWSEQLV